MRVLECDPRLSSLTQDAVPLEGIVARPLAAHVVHQDSRDREDVCRFTEQVTRDTCRCHTINEGGREGVSEAEGSDRRALS